MLSVADALQLRMFLEHPARPPGTLRYHELQGFLFSVASAPNMVSPSDWIPIVFGDQEAGYASLDEAEAVLGDLTALFDSINEAMGNDDAVLPPDCTFRDPTLANLEEHAPVAEWSRGFLRGNQWLEESWEPYVPEDLAQEFSLMLVVLSFFSSPRVAEAFAAEMQRSDVPALAEIVRRAFPGVLAG